MTIAELKSFSLTFDGILEYDELHRQLYATDASVYRKLPLAVAFPKSELGIQQILKLASDHGVGVVPRAAGTSLAGQCVGDGIIVDVSRFMTDIISFDKDKKTVVVQPGVIRDELNDYLRPYGLHFGPNTSTSNRCMIGGMLGNNSSGTTSIQYGVTRDKVLNIKSVLSNGDVIDFHSLDESAFKQKMKLESLEGKIYSTVFELLSDEQLQENIHNEFPKPEIHRRNTGYALDSLLASNMFTEGGPNFNMCQFLSGSEGTLAFATEITLQLDELPPDHTAMIAAHYEDLSACLKDVVSAMEHNLYTCELMDDIILECTEQNKKYQPYRFFIKDKPKSVLLLELRAHSRKELDSSVNDLMATLKASGRAYHLPVLRGDEIEMALELRKAGLGLLGNMVGDNKAVACIEDTSVALSDLPDFIDEFTELMKSYDQRAVYYAHAGAGELHLRPILNLKQSEGVQYFKEITTEVAKLTKRYKGSFSGEHGDGIVRGAFIPMMVGPVNYNAMVKIKQVFDPNGIMNPGKIVNPLPMDESLRYQTGREEPNVETIMDFSDTGGILRLAENCNGSGDCRKTASSGALMCPSYQATKDEKDSTRGRANVLREVLSNNDAVNKFDDQALKEVMELCISCKGCASDCPSNVNIANAKAEFLYQYQKTHGASRSQRLFGFSSIINKRLSKFPGFFNALYSFGPSASLIKSYTGVAKKRRLPKLSSRKLVSKLHNQAINTIEDPDVILYVDEFSNHFDADIAVDTWELLNGLGYTVGVVNQLDSARALISKGFLEEARAAIDKNIEYFKNSVNGLVPIIGIEPSAILGFRDEFLRLATNKSAAAELKDRALLIEEFLSSEFENGRINSASFTKEAADLRIHVHCHQKALSNQKHTFDLLNIPENYRPRLISSGCCGMAGSFGYEKDHYELSMQIGSLRLFPAIEKTGQDSIIVANGTSCRHQIMDGTGRKALHPVTVMRNALILGQRQ